MSDSVMHLEVAEQPAKLHRFRYSKEVNDSRMGSILHGRSSAKVPVKITVTVGGFTASAPMKLSGCTVFENLAPHPFYLFGDGCSKGVFEHEFQISEGRETVEISLDRIGIVCTPKKKSNKGNESGSDDGYYQQRLSQYNFFGAQPKKDPLKGKEVNKLKLAFQLFVQNPSTKDWTRADCKPVATETILDAKIYSELTVDSVYPKQVYRADQDIWLYMKDPLPAEVINRYRVTVEFEDKTSVDVPALKVKKHLVVFTLSDVSKLPAFRREGNAAVTVTDLDAGNVSEPVTLFLGLPPAELSEPASKRQRGEKSTVETLDDLLLFVDDEQFIEMGNVSSDWTDVSAPPGTTMISYPSTVQGASTLD